MGHIIGQYLKGLRTKRKMTLRDVAKKTNISNAYLSQVERGKPRANPTIKILLRLAEVYKVPLSSLTKKVEEELRKKNKIGGNNLMPKKTIQLKAIVSRETWLKLRHMVETGQIKGMIAGVTKAVEEFVKKNEAKGS